MHPRPPPTLESFVPTAGAAEALALATAVAQEQAGAPRLLLLHGPSGVGKTHLLQAILHLARARYGWNSVIQSTGSELIHELVHAARHDDHGALYRRLAEAALVLVDDLHVLAERPVTQGEVARLLKAVMDRGARVACAVACPLKDIPVLAERIRALPEAKLARMERPGRDDMRRILKGLAAAAGLTLNAMIVTSIAGRCRGDVRLAVGTLTRRRFESALVAHPRPR